jgi:hypothetical protein
MAQVVVGRHAMSMAEGGLRAQLAQVTQSYFNCNPLWLGLQSLHSFVEWLKLCNPATLALNGGLERLCGTGNPTRISNGKLY